MSKLFFARAAVEVEFQKLKRGVVGFADSHVEKIVAAWNAPAVIERIIRNASDTKLDDAFVKKAVLEMQVAFKNLREAELDAVRWLETRNR